MLSFDQYLNLTEELPKEAQEIIKRNPNRLKAILQFINLQQKKGTDLGGKLKVQGAAHTREFGKEHDEVYRKVKI